MDVNRQLSRVFAVRMLLIKRKHNSTKTLGQKHRIITTWFMNYLLPSNALPEINNFVLNVALYIV